MTSIKTGTLVPHAPTLAFPQGNRYPTRGKTNHLGFRGELWVAAMFQAHGYHVRLIPKWHQANHDLTVEGIPCEVKTSCRKTHLKKYRVDGSPVYGDRWQWRVHDTADQMKGDWLLVLVALTNHGPRGFVLPGSLHRKQMSISSHPDEYRGYLSPFLNAWDISEYLRDRAYKDQLNFEDWREA